jgi:hypothetical protein
LVSGQRSAPATADVFAPTVVVGFVNTPFTVAVASFTLPGAPPNAVVGVASGAAFTFTEQAIVDWGDGTLAPGMIESTGSGQFMVVGTHTYAAAGSYITSTVITLPDQSTIIVSGAIQVFGSLLESPGGFFGGGGGFGGTPNSTPASRSAGPSSPPVSANDHGSPAVSFQAILFSPAANTPIGPGISAPAPALRTGYYYPSTNAVLMSNATPLKAQESGSQEDHPNFVNVIPLQVPGNLTALTVAPLGLTEESASPLAAMASAPPETPFQYTGLLLEDSLPELACLPRGLDLLHAGLPDDELERVAAMALARVTPALVGAVGEGLRQTAAPELVQESQTADRGALAVVLVVCLCMWPRQPRGEPLP